MLENEDFEQEKQLQVHVNARSLLNVFQAYVIGHSPSFPLSVLAKAKGLDLHIATARTAIIAHTLYDV